MALLGLRRFALATAVSLVALGGVATSASAAPCPAADCVTVTQLAPVDGATLSGTVELRSRAVQSTAGRGDITRVEWWLYHDDFKAQNPNNEEGKVLLSELIGADPTTGTKLDGVWTSSWTVQSGTITARDGDYAHGGMRTYTLPTTGQYEIETHVLDAQWDADNPAPGGPPGRSGKHNVTIDFTGAPPAPTPSPDGPCVPAGSCVAVVQTSPAEGADVSGTVTLQATVEQSVAGRGDVKFVEWWLVHPSFRAHNPNNEASRIMLDQQTAPTSGTAMDGTWTGSWTVPTGDTITGNDADPTNGDDAETYPLPATGQYRIETHALDTEWESSFGEAPGRDGANVKLMPLQAPAPTPTPTPPPPPPPAPAPAPAPAAPAAVVPAPAPPAAVPPPAVVAPVVPVVRPVVKAPVVVPKPVILPSAKLTAVATARLKRGRVGAVIGTVTTMRGRRAVATRGLRLTVQRWDPKKKTWVSLKTIVSAPNGSVRLALRPAVTTNYRVVFPGSKTWGVARSRVVQIKVF